MGNRLTRLYTGTGDDGTTGLAGGERCDKDSIRLCAMGNVDELNSIIGLLRAVDKLPSDINGYLLNIQHRLFDIGGELAMPGNAAIKDEAAKKLEKLIDNYNQGLPELKEFILPGGILAASTCHMARTVCRRVERSLVSLAREEYVNPESLRYINRLSDFLFVVARELNQLQEGSFEVYWDSERLKNSV